MPVRTAFLALLLAPLAVAAAQDPIPSPVAAEAVPASFPSAPAQAPEGAGPRKGFALSAGWGYYEQAHVGASYHWNDRGAVSLFGGYGLGKSDQGATIGAGFSHAIFGPLWMLQPGVSFKTIYWQQSDELYGWKNLSLVLGPSLAADLGNGLRVALDGGVALTFALESDRKQDFTFGSPTRWNGSVCLEISYRLGAR